MDLTNIIKWFATFFLAGIIFTPLTFSIFSNFRDKGYIFSKIIGIAFISYSVFIVSWLKILPFSFPEIVLVSFAFLLINIYIAKKTDFIEIFKENLKLIILEELIFLLGLIFWSFVRGNLPDINGLEKFMDFGMTNSILRSNYFPPVDMWYPPLTINYYYFGHLVTAVIMKASNITSSIGYNLMLASLFTLTFTSIFSLSLNLFDNKKFSLKALFSAFLSASLVTFGGNLTTIYAFFKAYMPMDKPVPFWTLPFLPFSFPNGYWYPNATRFIEYTIHEFPLYSFVVSDLHGHVLDIPFVLLTIALLYSIYLSRQLKNGLLILVGFLLAIMYMTNAWDGLIYLLLTFFIFIFVLFKKKDFTINFLYKSALTIGGFFVFSLPFSLNFKPFVSGIGVICAPKFLTSIGKLGPFLFEADHCQRSPIWQLIILYGFFYFFVISFILFIRFNKNYKINLADKFIAFLIILSTILLIVPEFLYIKDIYPLHYRANTMFKLSYEAFIMLSLSCGYIIIKIFSNIKSKKNAIFFLLPSFLLIYMVLSYSVLAINSFYADLKTYKGLDGISYLKNLYPGDYYLINWLNKNVQGQPTVLEASGDSYTDYARISANTGLPTVIGWPVHEWLWRGTYDIVAPRIEDVSILYTSKDINETKRLIKKYNISFVVVSDLEKKKYTNLEEERFKAIGKLVFEKDGAKLYQITF